MDARMFFVEAPSRIIDLIGRLRHSIQLRELDEQRRLARMIQARARGPQARP